MRVNSYKYWILGAPVVCAALPAGAQTPFDRADPTVAQRTLPLDEKRHADRADQALPSPVPLATSSSTIQLRPLAITVAGAEAIDLTAFAEVIALYSGRELTQQDLLDLAAAVAKVARDKGYPLATAKIDQQVLTNGVLKVTLDEGRIDAVRVIGATSATADRILAARLLTGTAVRKSEMERAILLVDDLPGIDVVSSQYVRQEGFGILLVTIKRDRASAFVQLDNRGSEEVGPIRSTALASLRGIATSADELSLIAAQTPLQPKEFLFIRARYSMPVGHNGDTVAISGSLGDAAPGASLKMLDVKSNSREFGISFRRPLMRGPRNNLAIGFNLRRLHIEQLVGPLTLRDERLTLLDTALESSSRVAGGMLRAEVHVTAGLPLGGVSRQGDPRLSRSDGDARFLTASYMWDWHRKLGGGFGVTVASAGQVASRPLLSTAELGVGGPSFGRAYDYSERSGENGLLGSLEVQFDLGRGPAGVHRAQLYASVDGGSVYNLRGGGGGGSLVATSVGIRFSKGRLGMGAELSFPLNRDRFDTGRRNSRLSLRLSRSF